MELKFLAEYPRRVRVFNMLSENFVAKKKSDNERFPHVHRVIPSEVEESSFAASVDSSTPLGMTKRELWCHHPFLFVTKFSLISFKNFIIRCVSVKW